MSGLLAVLQTDLAASLMKYLHDSHGVLLEIAKPIRNSPTFAWEASTHTHFTLHKLAEHLRTDSLSTGDFVVYGSHAPVQIRSRVGRRSLDSSSA